MPQNYNSKTDNHFPILYFDGGSRGNPGEAAGAAVIVMPDGQQYTVSKYIQLATNNEAEYTGLIIGLQQAEDLGIEELTVKGDSQLVINQVTGTWKVNSPHLKQFYNEAQRLSKRFKKISLNWVRRNENSLADAAVNQCIDQGVNINNLPKKETKYQKNDLESQEKLKDKQKDLQKAIPYAKGDIIILNQPYDSQLKHQGVVISEPQFSTDGNWIITIKLEEFSLQSVD